MPTGVPPPCCVFASAMGCNVCWGVCGQALEAINMAALQQIADLNLRTISNIVYGCACVHFWDRRLMDALADRAIQLAGQGTGQVCIRTDSNSCKINIESPWFAGRSQSGNGVPPAYSQLLWSVASIGC